MKYASLTVLITTLRTTVLVCGHFPDWRLQQRAEMAISGQDIRTICLSEQTGQVACDSETRLDKFPFSSQHHRARQTHDSACSLKFE